MKDENTVGSADRWEIGLAGMCPYYDGQRSWVKYNRTIQAHPWWAKFSSNTTKCDQIRSK